MKVCQLLEGDGEGGGGFWEKGLGRVGWVDLKGRRQSWILSSCNLASVVAWGNDMGCMANTSRRMSGERPEMKQLRRNGGGKPIIRLANLSNSIK